MDLADYLKNVVKAQRQDVLARSDQLTLWELILKIENVVGIHKDEHDYSPSVVYDFADTFPTDIRSRRGIYAELALNYTSEWVRLSADEFLNMLKEAVGKEFEWYKWGTFRMSKHTPIRVDNYGKANNTAVIDVVDDNYRIILITGMRES